MKIGKAGYVEYMENQDLRKKKLLGMLEKKNHLEELATLATYSCTVRRQEQWENVLEWMSQKVNITA
jgi:hypothetical protein